MRKLVFGTLMFATMAMTPPASAAETITYTYDAKGRLVKVEHSGSANNGLKAEYTQDRANNRTKLKITGSPNPAP